MLKPDVRAFKNKADGFDRCRSCGTSLVVLPEDRRQGFCYDCFDPLETSVKGFAARIPDAEATMNVPHRH